MTNRDKASVYRIYLLTVWQEQDQAERGDGGWRFHLTDPQTGQRYGFTTPAALLAALQQATREPPPLEETP
ncbi:MAG: hypothetical protein R3E79_56160 [Caldilineaceae bacterium]